MNARDLMSKDIDVCALNDSAAEAVQIMIRRNCGFVPVVLGHHNRVLEGVVTDRDIALFLGEASRPAKEVKINEFYTRNPKTVGPEASLEEIAKLMEEFQIHRIPVIDSNRKLIGVVSLKDLAQEASREKGIEHPAVTESKIGEIIETIAAAD